jgi:hypothetical protein
MIRYFTARQLANRLEINLAKWKRWARHFLPPDPLGGLQSGYTRQYHPDEVFRVRLGGILVGQLKFTLPQAAMVLDDLAEWMEANGFCFTPKPGVGPTCFRRFSVDILRGQGGRFAYRIEERGREGGSRDILIGPWQGDADGRLYGHVLNLTAITLDFCRRLELPLDHFSAIGALKTAAWVKSGSDVAPPSQTQR